MQKEIKVNSSKHTGGLSTLLTASKQVSNCPEFNMNLVNSHKLPYRKQRGNKWCVNKRKICLKLQFCWKGGEKDKYRGQSHKGGEKTLCKELWILRSHVLQTDQAHAPRSKLKGGAFKMVPLQEKQPHSGSFLHSASQHPAPWLTQPSLLSPFPHLYRYVLQHK